MTGENRLFAWLALGAVGALILVLLGVPKLLIIEVFVCIVVVAAIVLVAATTVFGRIEYMLIGWVLLFPLGYYFLSLPRERSIFTLDRAVMTLFVVAMAFSARTPKPLPASLRTSGIWWGLFLVAAFASLHNMDNVLGATKEVLDAFVFPAVLALFIWRSFPVREKLLELHIVTSLMCIYVAAISVAEVLTGQDFLPLPAAIFFSDDTGIIQRVNGPFATNNSLGLIGLTGLLILIFFRRAIGSRMPRWQRVLHVFGLGGAATMAITPMFRSIAITLVLIGILELCWSKSAKIRLMVVGVALAAVAGMLFLRATAPVFFESRISDMSDLYARVAQYEQTWALFKSHPINGVGLANYANAAENVPAAYYRGVESVGSAHNTMASILVDTGITGFVTYFLSQIFFFLGFWRLRRGTPATALASRFALYIFLSYWITGMMLTSGYYSDLNLWYLFSCAIVYKFAYTEREPEKAFIQDSVPGSAFRLGMCPVALRGR